MKILDRLDMYLDEACPGDKKKSKGKGKGLGTGKGKGPIGKPDTRGGPSPRKKRTLGFVGAMKK